MRYTEINDEELKDVPYELIPQLAGDEDFIRKAERLRELVYIKPLFDDKKDKATGLPNGEYARLKLELGARVAAAGYKSVAFGDVRILNAEGGKTKGKVTGPAALKALGISNAEDANIEDYKRLWAIALAAVDLDENVLLQNGIAPHVIEASRAPGSYRSSSVRAELIGSKGTGGQGVAGKSVPGQVQ